MTRDEMKVEGPLHIVCQCNKCKAEKMNIIKLAKQAGFMDYELDDGTIEAFDKRYAKFAALVAAHEREACAKKCEAARETIWEYHEEHLKAAACNVCTNLAQAIRARGTT